MAQEIVRLSTESELEALHVETFINTTPLVTKVTDESALRGVLRGNVKTGKKALKDIALAVSHLFPDSAFDTTLDTVAGFLGISPRLGAAQSSTWVRLIATPGTIYTAGENSVSDNKGNVFDISKSLVMGSLGYDYVPVRSQQSGAFTNVNPYTIININPQPAGHIGLLNEYAATGGRDAEDDAVFLQRIKEGPDLLARDTISYITQTFIQINTNVLRVIYQGVAQNGKVQLAILTVNGILLTDDELNTLLQQGGKYFSFTELNALGSQSYGVQLINATYYPIDIDFRVSLFVGTDLLTVAQTVQQKFQKLVDFRFWDSSVQNVIWTDLLTAVKNTTGVQSAPDNYFFPNKDIIVDRFSFPRFRGFIVRDLQGNVLLDTGGIIQNIFYANQSDPAFAVSVL